MENNNYEQINQTPYRNQPPNKKPKSKKKKRLRIIIIIELIIILILIPIGYLYYQFGRMPKLELNNVKINDIDTSELSGYRNIAVFGVDSRANDLKKNTRSDSIMIVSINKKTKDVKICSIFRDTYVNVEGHGFTKITHAYAYGGPELAINTINRNFDLNISDFVTVNFSAVTNMVDLVGGITLDIQKDELKHVNNYTRDVARINGTKYTYLKHAGKQKVDGTQATAYCRVRYTAGSDFKRAERQRTVLKEIFKKTKSAGIPTLLKIADKMMPQVYTSLSQTEMLGLAKDVLAYDIKDQQGFPFDKTSKKVNGMSVVLADSLSSNVTKLHEFLFKQTDYKPSKTVQEYSSTIASR